MKISIEPQYFPPVNFFSYLSPESNDIFLICEEYKKMTFRNRCVIAGANGPINLTVPIEGGREQHTLFNDVKIDNRQKWQSEHWKSLCACYNHSPWFEHYRDSLAVLFRQKFELLIDLNVSTFKWIISELKLPVSIQIFTDRKEADLDLINKFSPRNLKNEQPVIRYQQIFEERTGFLPHLSILDLLFCSGSNSMDIIRTASISKAGRM